MAVEGFAREARRNAKRFCIPQSFACGEIQPPLGKGASFEQMIAHFVEIYKMGENLFFTFYVNGGILTDGFLRSVENEGILFAAEADFGNENLF